MANGRCVNPRLASSRALAPHARRETRYCVPARDRRVALPISEASGKAVKGASDHARHSAVAGDVVGVPR